MLKADLLMEEIRYAAGSGEEVFLQFVSKDEARTIAGFLRLALPARLQSDVGEVVVAVDVVDAVDKEVRDLPGSHEALALLEGLGIIREVHVYGQALGLGEAAQGRAQHQGMGKRLVERAVEIAADEGYPGLAVISAIGTRAYYRKLGFRDEGLYPEGLYPIRWMR